VVELGQSQLLRRVADERAAPASNAVLPVMRTALTANGELAGGAAAVPAHAETRAVGRERGVTG